MLPLWENWTLCTFVDCATDILSRRETGLRLSCHEQGPRSTHGQFDSIWRQSDRSSPHRSQRVILRRNVLDQIIQKTHRVHVLEKSGPLQGLGGMYLIVCGKTQISVAGIHSPLEVVVCDTLPYDMILGDTFLRKYH